MSRALVIVGLDLGTHTGWALDDDAAGTWDLSPRRHESSGMRLIKLRSSLTDLANAQHIDLLAYEEVLHLKGVAEVVFGELMGVVKVLCHDMAIEYVGISVGTVKKLATSRGNANKAEMMAATRARWPNFRGTEDEADARWVRETAIKNYGAGVTVG